MPLVFGSALRHPFGTKSGLTSDGLVAMKSRNVDSASGVTPKPVPTTAGVDSIVENEKSAHWNSCERFTKAVSGEFMEICVLLKPYLLDDL